MIRQVDIVVLVVEKPWDEISSVLRIRNEFGIEDNRYFWVSSGFIVLSISVKPLIEIAVDMVKIVPLDWIITLAKQCELFEEYLAILYFAKVVIRIRDFLSGLNLPKDNHCSIVMKVENGVPDCWHRASTSSGRF